MALVSVDVGALVTPRAAFRFTLARYPLRDTEAERLL
jgi:hypothetical protein